MAVKAKAHPADGQPRSASQNDLQNSLFKRGPLKRHALALDNLGA